MDKKKQQAFLDLYEPVHDRFERFCRARVYGDMDYKDLVNETLMKAFEKFDTLRSKEAFLSFLFSISIRTLANHKRKKKEDVHAFDDRSYEVIDHNSKTDTSMEVYMLHKALAELPEAQRECIILFEISGFNIKEIAEMQETSESNIKQRLRRSRMKLKEILTYVNTDTYSDTSEPTEIISAKGKNYE